MNTDNAWIEYTVMNYHLAESSLFDNIEIFVSCYFRHIYFVSFILLFLLFEKKNKKQKE
jgi:hypothetical protein